MAITFSNDSAWDDNSPVGRGVAIEDDRYGFEGKLRLTLAEALQVRDELLRRYPLGDTVGYVPRADGGIPDHMLPPIPPPQAALSLEVGKWYLRRDGRKVKIVKTHQSDTHHFQCSEGYVYTDDGYFFSNKSEQDENLIAETTAPVEGLHPWVMATENNICLQMSTAPLSIGDTVRLKSGGPVMTIVSEDAKSWVCAYDDGGKIAYKSLPAAALVRAKP